MPLGGTALDIRMVHLYQFAGHHLEMTPCPIQDRSPGNAAWSRRDFLMRTGGAALGLGAGAMLAGCKQITSAATGGSAANQGLGPGGLPLARPDKRVSLPIYEDNQPIAGGL